MDRVLKLKARHFKGTDFSSHTDCAICKAAKEQFSANEVNTSTTYICLNNSDVMKLEYTYSQFKTDQAIAATKANQDDIIRSVKLTGE